MAKETLTQRVAKLESAVRELEARLAAAKKDRPAVEPRAETGGEIDILRAEVASLSSDKQQLQQQIAELEAGRVRPTPTQLVQSFRDAMNDLQSSLEPQAEDRVGFAVDRFDVGLKAAVAVDKEDFKVRFELPALTDVVPAEQLSNVNFTFSSVPKVEIADESLVEVPVLLGRTLEVAQTLLAARGLAVGAESQLPSHFAAGTVIGQEPQGGDLVEPASSVDLTLSTGPGGELVDVPDVVGLALAAAQATITTAGLSPGEVTEQESPEPPGTVLAQDPAAGARVPPGSVVDLVVAAQQEQVPVPEVLGQPEEEARDLIIAAGLTVGSVEPNAEPGPVGIVLEQDPAGGILALIGSPVALVVSIEGAAVPQLIGQPVETAGKILDGIGLVLGQVTAQVTTQQPDGFVLAQQPIAGDYVAFGSAVDVTVAAAPPEP